MDQHSETNPRRKDSPYILSLPLVSDSDGYYSYTKPQGEVRRPT